MARKTPAEAARTRKKILDAAGEIFSRDGIAETTLEQIAQQAGVTRGAIYWHFKGKQDLLQTLFDEQKLPLENSLAKDSDLDTGWGLLRKALIETVSGGTPRRLSEIMIYQRVHTPDSAAAHPRLIQAREYFMDQLQLLLNNAVARGELVATLDVPAVKDFSQVCISGLLYECLENTGNEVKAISSVLETLLHLVKNPPEHLLKSSGG
ncbi:HTH-type transcriptional regulator SrpR [compost metagenome]